MKLEQMTLKCIPETLKTFEDAKGKPFDPRDSVHELIQQILAILVSLYCNYSALTKIYATYFVTFTGLGNSTGLFKILF